VRVYELGKVYYESDVVVYEGSTFQALRDTAQSPGGDDWIRLAERGRDARSPTIRGTYKEEASYQTFDVVALNGSSFIAKKEQPGPCPGPDWQLIASAGKPGKQGVAGPRGERGAKGDAGPAAATIVDWKIDRSKFVVLPIMSDGSEVPPINMRELFEQFQEEAG
jgi:hypothetical protein